jgi:arginine decarboxylase
MSNSIAAQPTASSSQRKDRRSKAARDLGPAEEMIPRANRIGQFLLMHSARLDNWREIIALAESWKAGAAQRADVEPAIGAMEAVEGFHAFPGPRLFAALRERVAANDADGSARLARRIPNALIALAA